MKKGKIEGVNIIGIASIRPGEHWRRSLESMAGEAAYEAIQEAGLSPTEIDGLYVGNMLAEPLGGQANLGASLADCLCLDVPAFAAGGGCASGGLALKAAVEAVEYGDVETALVLGAEKMTDWPVSVVTKAMMSAASEQEKEAGLTMPGLFAILAKIHAQEYGTTLDQLAAASVNSHFNATFNPKAQYPKAITLEQVRRSHLVADPLRVLDCSPISDGAAALIISNRKPKSETAVRIVAGAVALDTLGLGQRESLTGLKATRQAANLAYEQAEVGPEQISVAEVDDAFANSHILAIEDLGFREKGQAGEFIESGETRLGRESRLVINPSGGLKASGNPLGAAGVYQAVEMVRYLRENPEGYGLTHDISGTGAIAVVHILKR